MHHALHRTGEQFLPGDARVDAAPAGGQRREQSGRAGVAAGLGRGALERAVAVGDATWNGAAAASMAWFRAWLWAFCSGLV